MAGGFFGSIVKGIGNGAKATIKSVKTGSNFGKYVGKTVGGLDSAPRGTYLNDVNAFKVGNMTKSQADQAALLVGIGFLFGSRSTINFTIAPLPAVFETFSYFTHWHSKYLASQLFEVLGTI